MQYGILIVAFLIPAVAISRALTGHSIPQAGLTFSNITERLNAIQVDLGFTEYTKPFTEKSKLDVLCITFALMVGTAGLPHVIVRFYTTPSVRAARWSAGWALLFIAMLYTTAPALAAFARYNLIETLHGAKVQRVETMQIDESSSREIYYLAKVTDQGTEESIDWATSWQKTGLITFVDLDGDGRIELHSDGGKFAEAEIDQDIIVLATPEVAKLAPWVIALVATGGLAAALSTAAGLLLVISSSVAHDLYIHFFDPHASERRRVFVGRLMILIAIVFAGYFGINPPGFVAQVVAFAFGLAAASFFPIILLGIFDKRTNRAGAICGMIVGLLFTAAYIAGNRSDKIFGTDEPLMSAWCFGISAEGIGTIGCLLNFIVTFTVSRLTAPPPARVLQLVESIRIPAGSLDPQAHFDESDAGADNP